MVLLIWATSTVARPIWIGGGLAHHSLSARGRDRGGFLPHRHRWLAGKIWPADAWWSAVAGEQASRVADRIGGRREGRAHQSRGFHGGANRPVGSDGGGAEE
jgi:hypothetical protein